MARHFTTLIAVARLTRILNAVALGALFIGVIRFRQEHHPNLWLAALAWCLTAASAYAYNDLHDIEIDRINRPTRPLPAGTLSPLAAWWLCSVLALIAIGVASTSGIRFAGWIVGALAVSVVYSRLLRSWSTVASNTIAAGLVTCVPLSIGADLNKTTLALVSGLGFLMFAREMQKDVWDYAGDRDFRPLPLLLRLGRRQRKWVYGAALTAAAVALVCAVGLSAQQHSVLRSVIVGMPLFAALIVNCADNAQPKLQAGLMKATSYLLVCLLLTSQPT